MRPDLLIQRIRDKSGHPTFPDPTDRCLPWTGASSHKGLTRRKLRDAEGSPYHAFVSARPFARILGSYVHLVVRKLLDPDAPPARASQACTTPLCVNPAHWTFVPLSLPPLPEPISDTTWTLSEAQELLDLYLAEHSFLNLDRRHNFLIDIPPDLLDEALSKVGK